MAPPASTNPADRGSGLTRKLGPLPVWAWAVIVLAVAAWFLFRGSSAAAGTQQQGQTATSPFPQSGSDSGGGAGGSGLDPSLLAALAQQNSTLEQGLLDAFQGRYAGGYSSMTASGAPVPDNVASTLSVTPQATTPAALDSNVQTSGAYATYSAPASVTQPMSISPSSPFASNTDISGGPADQLARSSVGGGVSSSDVVPFNQTPLAQTVSSQTSPSQPTPSLSAARGNVGKGQVLQ